MSAGLSIRIDENVACGPHRGARKRRARGAGAKSRRGGGRHWEPCRRGMRDQEGHRERAQAGDAQVVSAIRRVTGNVLKRETRVANTIRRSATCARGGEGLVCGLSFLLLPTSSDRRQGARDERFLRERGR